MNKIKKIFLLNIIIAFVVGAVAFDQPEDRHFAIAKNLDIFATLFKEVNTYYVDEVNPNKLMRTGIDAMLKSLDPYTNYIPEDDIEDFRTMTTGQYGGIGAIIGRRNDKPMILMPYEGYPAHDAGLQIGDQILKIDGIDVSDKSVSEISKLLKGEFNTKVNVTIQRYGEDNPVDVQINREKIQVNAVPYHGMVDSNTGYIKLTDFTSGASKEVKKALLELKEQGAERLIFDLRDNPGGLLTESINISNLFIPKHSEVVSTRGKVTDWNKTFRALNSPVDTLMPLAILTSDRSASASEIVSGVMQDYDRGIIVGENTYGKGLVQATRPLSYNSQLKVTTAKYYTPSGRCIQAIDYSQRKDDGSVAAIPDSLRSAFKTRNGRVVYDGAGIEPDIKVDEKTFAPITTSLVQKGLLFEYANEYALKNPSIPSAKSFEISDEEYQDFLQWVKDKDYDYVTDVESSLDELIDNAKKEKYYNAIEGQIEDLRTKLGHNKDKDLITFKDEIRELLEAEIVSRYYFQKGQTEASFDDDLDIKAAIEILNDSDSMRTMLSRANKK